MGPWTTVGMQWVPGDCSVSRDHSGTSMGPINGNGSLGPRWVSRRQWVPGTASGLQPVGGTRLGLGDRNGTSVGFGDCNGIWEPYWVLVTAVGPGDCNRTTIGPGDHGWTAIELQCGPRTTMNPGDYDGSRGPL